MYFTGDVREPEHLEKVYASMAAGGFPVRGQLGVAVVEMLLVFGPLAWPHEAQYHKATI